MNKAIDPKDSQEWADVISAVEAYGAFCNQLDEEAGDGDVDQDSVPITEEVVIVHALRDFNSPGSQEYRVYSTSTALHVTKGMFMQGLDIVTEDG